MQNTKYILSKGYQRSHSWVLECTLNPFWSKLRLRENHDLMLFSFFTCLSIPKTLLTQKSDSIFVHRLLRYSIFPHIYLGFLFPFYKKNFFWKGEQELQLDVRKNGISQQPMNENGIRFLRQKRFWNQRLCEERKQHYVMFFPHS